MGNISLPSEPGKLFISKPDSATTTIHPKSAEYFISKCQKLGVPLTSFSRHTLAACKLPCSALKLICTKGGKLGRLCLDQVEKSIKREIDQTEMSRWNPDLSHSEDAPGHNHCSPGWIDAQALAGKC